MGIFHSYVSLPEGIEYFQYAMLYPSVSEICRSIQGRSLAGVRAQIPRAKRAASPCGCRLAPGSKGGVGRVTDLKCARNSKNQKNKRCGSVQLWFNDDFSKLVKFQWHRLVVSQSSPLQYTFLDYR